MDRRRQIDDGVYLGLMSLAGICAGIIAGDVGSWWIGVPLVGVGLMFLIRAVLDIEGMRNG